MSAKRIRPVSKAVSTPVVAPAPIPAPRPEWVAKLAALGRSPWGYILASIIAIAPCFWQARIQAGELSSHIYNSWLAQLTEAGKLPGLLVVNQTTNILFDWILSG